MSSNGRPICQGIPLYQREYSPCRGCPDAGRCTFHSIKSNVCLRYMETVRKLQEEATA